MGSLQFENMKRILFGPIAELYHAELRDLIYGVCEHLIFMIRSTGTVLGI
jgi:hypothetical protein